MSDRTRRRPAVESLEGRMLLAGSLSPTRPVLNSPEPLDVPTPRQLGAAYRQVEAIQARTLLALGSAYRRVQAASAQLAADANRAIASDRRIVQMGAGIASRAEQGLDIARGIEDQAVTSDKSDISNRLFLNGLGNLIINAQTLSEGLTISAGRSTDAVINNLKTLGEQLTSDAGSHR
jgi:hypothetical protein